MIRNVYNGWLWHEWLPGITSWNLRVVVWVYCPGHAGGRSNKGHPSLEYWMSRDELLWKINESVEWWHNSCRNSTIAAAGVGKLVWNESVTIERDGPGVWQSMCDCDDQPPYSSTFAGRGRALTGLSGVPQNRFLITIAINMFWISDILLKNNTH